MTNCAPKTSSPLIPGALARIQMLGGDSTAATLEAHVMGREQRLLFLRSDSRLRAGCVVRIDVSGGMVLGEVAVVQSEAGSYVIGVDIDQVISSVSGLARLMERVMAESKR